MSNAVMSNVQYCTPGNFCQGYQGTCFVSASSRAVRGVEYAKNNKGAFCGLATTQLILGICLIAIGISAIPICSNTNGCGEPEYNSWYYEYYGVWTMMSTNIWGGGLVMLFAIFGLVQVCRPSTCTIVTNLTLSVFGAIFAPFLMSLEIIAAIVSWKSVSLVTLHSIASVIFFILFILFIVSASYAGRARGCCTGCCDGCCCQEQPEMVSIIQGSQPHVVNLPNGQTLILQGNPQGVPISSSYAFQPPQYSTVCSHVVGVSPATQPGPSSHGVANHAYVVDIPPSKE